MGRRHTQRQEPATDNTPLGDVLRPVSPLHPAGVLARLLALVVALPLLLLGARATLLLAAAAVALLSRRHRHWQRAGVPHRRPLPLVGSVGPLLLHLTSPSHLLADLHLRPPDGRPDCPLVGFYIFDRPALLVRDPDLVRQLLVKDFSDFPDRHTEAAPADALGRLNMFGARAALWRRLRVATSPAFTGARMRAMLPHVDRCACAMVQRLLDSGARGTRPVKVRDVASRCITDILTSCLLGVEGGALSGCDGGWRGAVRGVFGFGPGRALEVLGVFVAPHLRPLRLLFPRFFGASADRFFREAFAELADHRRPAAASAEKPAHVFDMLMAFSSKETLRKYPALPYVERRCRRPCSLGACAGVPLEVEAGTPVFVSLLGLHHDPRFFPHPQRFDPERFSEDACRDRHPYCYAPFGHGPRSCVGMRLGLLALKVCVAHVISRLRVSLPPEAPSGLRMSALALLLSPVGGVPLLFTPLSDPDSRDRHNQS